eukprot:6177174-Pleurochrysis_carterae.AAC.6
MAPWGWRCQSKLARCGVACLSIVAVLSPFCAKPLLVLAATTVRTTRKGDAPARGDPDISRKESTSPAQLRQHIHTQKINSTIFNDVDFCALRFKVHIQTQLNLPSAKKSENNSSECNRSQADLTAFPSHAPLLLPCSPADATDTLGLAVHATAASAQLESPARDCVSGQFASAVLSELFGSIDTLRVGVAPNRERSYAAPSHPRAFYLPALI